MIKVVLIGSGNVAQHLIQVFLQAQEVDLVQAVARNPSHLAALLPMDKITNDYQKITEADVYIIAVSDDAIAEVAAQLPFINRLVVHTSGSSGISVLQDNNRKGVFYPLQTFTKGKAIDFAEIPICIEVQLEEDYQLLERLGHSIAQKVVPLSSEQRKSLHVAAVFVCNFVNHLYHIGHEICTEHHIPFEVLHPLIQETARKIESLAPSAAQTGPAMRNDTQTIEKHLDFIENPAYKTIYQLLTQSIQHVKKL